MWNQAQILILAASFYNTSIALTYRVRHVINLLQNQNTKYPYKQGRTEVRCCPPARGKKQVWRPLIRTYGFSDENVLYLRKYLRHCWDFSATPVIRRPQERYSGFQARFCDTSRTTVTTPTRKTL